MSSLFRLGGLMTVVAPLSIAAQAPDSGAAAPATTISGYLTSSYTASSHDADGTLVGRLFGRDHDQFMFNAADVVFERIPATDRWDAGFRFEPTFGTNSAVVKSAGLDLGPDADIWQAYITLNIPHSGNHYFQVKAGKLATLMGLEVFEDVQNPTLDVGNQDIFLEPFTETGIEFDGKFGSRVDAELRVTNGWDLVVDNNRAKSVMVRLGLTPDAATSVALVGYTGPEQAGNTSNARSGANLLASHQWGAVTGWVQLDYGEEAGVAASGGTAKWSAAGAWLRADVAPKVSVGFRADYMNDRDGARTSGVLGFPANAGQQLSTVTATLILKQWAHALVRPELRYDHSTLAVFDSHHDQLSIAVGMSYLFGVK